METLYAVAIFIAQKFIQDTEIWFLEEFEIITEINATTIRKLEPLFLEGIDYETRVTSEQMEKTTVLV